jgi:hypothetical protein
MTDYATLLRDRVTLSVRCIDRIFMQGYVEKLQTGGGAAGYLLRQRKLPFPSSAAYKHIADKYAADVQLWAARNGIPIHHFEKGENKELYARPLIEAAAQQGGDGRVVLLGIAQEKASVWRSWRDKSYRGSGKRPQMPWGRQGQRQQILDSLSTVYFHCPYHLPGTPWVRPTTGAGSHSPSMPSCRTIRPLATARSRRSSCSSESGIRGRKPAASHRANGAIFVSL